MRRYESGSVFVTVVNFQKRGKKNIISNIAKYLRFIASITGRKFRVFHDEKIEGGFFFFF